MGFSKKHQVDGESLEGKKWVIAGITMRAPLRSISTKKPKDGCWEDEENLNSNSGSTTPTGKEAKIPEMFSCPPAPRKRRPVSICHHNRNGEFFIPPDLDSIFQSLAKAERAS